jgi:uridine kinase
MNTFVAIDGPGGGGKSTLAEAVAHHYGLDPETQIIHTDHYFEPPEIPGVMTVPGAPGGFNVVRFMEEVGIAVANPQHELMVREYDWPTRSYKERPAPSREQLVVVEGIKLIGLPIDWGAKVWVTTPRALREERFLQRLAENRRMKETDPTILRERFRLWADDAAVYETELDPYSRPDVVVVDGYTPAHLQLQAIAPVIDRLLLS